MRVKQPSSEGADPGASFQDEPQDLDADARAGDWADRAARVRPGDAVAAVHRLVENPGMLRMVAQPLVDLQSGHAAGYEPLARTPARHAQP